MFFKRVSLLTFGMILFFTLSIKAQNTQTNEILTFTYSELMQNKENYLGKTVRAKAFHIYGYEWSFLCDTKCKERAVETWVSYVDEVNLCKGSKGKLKKGRKTDNDLDNKAEVIYVGKLSAGGFGHFGIYPYQFEVSCIEKFKRLQVGLK